MEVMANSMVSRKYHDMVFALLQKTIDLHYRNAQPQMQAVEGFQEASDQYSDSLEMLSKFLEGNDEAKEVLYEHDGAVLKMGLYQSEAMFKIGFLTALKAMGHKTEATSLECSDWMNSVTPMD